MESESFIVFYVSICLSKAKYLFNNNSMEIWVKIFDYFITNIVSNCDFIVEISDALN
jgi:hypothetical protein